ncbi:transposable element Tcb1 transposase [Trichonephila clavipes]|nr:transposable element Tcb1 transposase [Trichonephila clavipes]
MGPLDAGSHDGPTWAIASTSQHHFTVCAYHSTPFTAEWSVRKTSIAWSTLGAEPQTSPPQWCDKRRMWVPEWNEAIFTEESRICLQYHNVRIRVWRHRGERMLNSCVMHPHTDPTSDIMVWGGIGYYFCTPLVRIAGTLNSQRYISEVLEPVVLPYLQDLVTTIFQQDNARPHVERIVQRFFVNHQIELLPWPARSPDLLPIENKWSLFAQRLTQITHPAAKFDLVSDSQSLSHSLTPHHINFGNVWKLLDLLYPKNTSKVSLNQCRGSSSGDLQQWWLIWLLILAGTTLHRSL